MSYHFNHHATWTYSPAATIGAINSASAANWNAVVASTAVSNANRWNAAVAWSNNYNAHTAAALNASLGYAAAGSCAAPKVNACATPRVNSCAAAPAVSSCARPVLSAYRSASACAANSVHALSPAVHSAHAVTSYSTAFAGACAKPVAVANTACGTRVAFRNC